MTGANFVASWPGTLAVDSADAMVCEMSVVGTHAVADRHLQVNHGEDP